MIVGPVIDEVQARIAEYPCQPGTRCDEPFELVAIGKRVLAVTPVPPAAGIIDGVACAWGLQPKEKLAA